MPSPRDVFPSENGSKFFRHVGSLLTTRFARSNSTKQYRHALCWMG